MVKLFTDEEIDERCKDYDPIPMKVAQDVLHRKADPNKINILNGVIKSDIKTGQPPANVNMYANQIGRMNFGVSAEQYLKEYNRFVSAKLIEEENRLMQEQIQLMGEEDVDVYDIESTPPSLERDSSAPFTEVKPKRKRRTKFQAMEAREMGDEDVDAPDVYVPLTKIGTFLPGEGSEEFARRMRRDAELDYEEYVEYDDT
mgnify:CR=1 FL=1|tara:strand:- start:1647 stop:2249 length:603 start_codon:yes stop_codon:yes gene_type:complete